MRRPLSFLKRRFRGALGSPGRPWAASIFLFVFVVHWLGAAQIFPFFASPVIDHHFDQLHQKPRDQKDGGNDLSAVHDAVLLSSPLATFGFYNICRNLPQNRAKKCKSPLFHGVCQGGQAPKNPAGPMKSGVGAALCYCRSSFGGTSSSLGTGAPFFLRWRTHSESRYSICPFTERKSSSAHAASAA